LGKVSYALAATGLQPLCSMDGDFPIS